MHFQKLEDPKIREDIITKRAAGYSLSAIADYYQVDHTSIMYHLRREAEKYIFDGVVRTHVIQMLRGGKTIKEVIEKYNRPYRVVTKDAILKCCELSGHPIERINQEVEAKKKGEYLPELPPLVEDFKEKTYLNKLEVERRPGFRKGWLRDGAGGWISTGKSYAQLQKEKTKKDKETLQNKKEELLAYGT